MAIASIELASFFKSCSLYAMIPLLVSCLSDKNKKKGNKFDGDEVSEYQLVGRRTRCAPVP